MDWPARQGPRPVCSAIQVPVKWSFGLLHLTVELKFGNEEPPDDWDYVSDRDWKADIRSMRSKTSKSIGVSDQRIRLL